MSEHYYNEHNPYRAAVLRERMEDGFLPKGVVDERDIEIVPDEDFLGYTQIHLFAGIGGFPLGLRQAGFPEDRRIVTGGFPCQDISNAGKRAGITGTRSRLWREMVRCIRVVRPELVFVENVAALLGRGMGVVLGDLAEIGYDAQGDCISAADVGAPHLRRRIWIVAHAISDRVRQQSISEQRRRSATIPEHVGEVSNPASLCGSEIVRHEPNGDVSRLLADSASERSEEWRIPIRSRRPFETTVDSDWDGETLANTESGRQPMCGISPKQERGDLGQSAFCGEDVADTKSDEEWRSRAASWRQQITIGRRSAQSRKIRNSAGEGFSQWEENPILKPKKNTKLKRSNRWPVEPNVGRVAHGVPKRVDRLAALGDAIVPACVEEVIRRTFPLN